MKKTCLLAVAVAFVATAFAEVDYSIDLLDISDHTCGWGRQSSDYWNGLRSHAPCRVRIPLGEGSIRFEGDAQVTESGGTVIFVVSADGKELWRSGVVRGTGKVHFNVPLDGARAMTIEATDAGDGRNCDHVQWYPAKVVFRDGTFPSSDVRAMSRQLGILTPPPRPEPRINGARVFGVRPGHPILFRVPATGEKPLTVEVGGLEAKGLENVRYDAATRILSGTVERKGDYELVFTARNAKGVDVKPFRLRVGETISLTPAMGWNSWNCFTGNVSDERVRSAADALLSTGLADHGWSYVVIDDCWMRKPRGKEPTRTPDGVFVPNARFPDMKGLADAVHAKGLKIGIYSSPGPETCGFNEGSWRHEEVDAKTFAEWGYDYLKYDWCSYSKVATGQGRERAVLPYRKMGAALLAQNRDIVFSLCQYGMENVSAWGASIGGNSWRTTGDVFDTWNSISETIARQKPLYAYTAPGAWNDPDMLCVGRMQWNDYLGSRLSPNEQYTHISLWALVAAPLMIGCDLTRLDAFTLALLTNDEVIEIDQDPLGKGAACIFNDVGYEIWARPLADGSIAVGLFNKCRAELTIPFEMERLGILCKWKVRDVWCQEDVGVFAGRYETAVPGHATKLLKLTPLACGKLRDGLTDVRDLVR